MDSILIAQEAAKMLVKGSKRKLFGFKPYQGNAAAICKSVIDDCWNKKHHFFQTSAGHYDLFYVRDFSWCCKSLLQLGYHDKVLQTLQFALTHYKKNNKVTTTITQAGSCFDFPCFSVDSLPSLLKSLNLVKNQELLLENKDFLNQQIAKFYNIVVDQETGLVKPHAHFSSIRDHAKRSSSCYDNCMVALLQLEIEKAKILDNPFKKISYPELIKKHFWNGKFFYADLARHEVVTGDANVFPFYCSIFYDPAMIRSAVLHMVKAGLDEPFPLKYAQKRHKHERFIAAELLAYNWQSHSIWGHMGPLYLSLLQHVDKKRAMQHLATYRTLVEEHKTFVEVFDKQGKPFQSFAYMADEGMLWAANLLVLLEQESTLHMPRS